MTVSVSIVRRAALHTEGPYDGFIQLSPAPAAHRALLAHGIKPTLTLVREIVGRLNSTLVALKKERELEVFATEMWIAWQNEKRQRRLDESHIALGRLPGYAYGDDKLLLGSL